jgi:hypothetical protein
VFPESVDQMPIHHDVPRRIVLTAREQYIEVELATAAENMCLGVGGQRESALADEPGAISAHERPAGAAG